MNVYISSTMYDVMKAKSMCSTKNGPCHLNLSYLSPQYVVLATPDTQDLSGTYVEISFIARFVTLLGVLGVAVMITCSILKSLRACHDESYAVTESDPISQHQEVKSIYGTYEEEVNCGDQVLQRIYMMKEYVLTAMTIQETVSLFLVVIVQLAKYVPKEFLPRIWSKYSKPIDPIGYGSHSHTYVATIWVQHRK